jgi:hypothetical protein
VRLAACFGCGLIYIYNINVLRGTAM